MKSICVLIILAHSQFCSIAAGDTIFVNHAASGLNDGSNWHNAYTSLQSGLASAEFGDQIWVASGTHYPTRSADTNHPTTTTTDPRDAAFWIPRGVQMFGGFIGNESAIDQRPAQLNHTVLSGDIGTKGIQTDNAYRIIYYIGYHEGEYGAFNSDQTIPAKLDGFQVTDSYSDKSSGAGIHTIMATVRTPDSPIIFLYPTRLFIENCVISNNYSSTNGGGAFLGGWSGDIKSCLFSENHSDSGGGAICIVSHFDTPNIHDTTFSNNTANDFGGAIYRRRDSFQPGDGPFPLLVTNCMITQNSSGRSGGGIAYTSHGDPRFPLVMMNCVLSKNAATISGGGLFVGNGVAISQRPRLYTDGAIAQIHSSTFADNSANTGGGVMAGVGEVEDANADLTIANSILWNNTAPSNAQANSIVSIKSSCIEGGGWTTLLGNISTDPLFYNPLSNDYSLTNGSSAADAGWNPLMPRDIPDINNNTDIAEPLPIDFNGRNRTLDSGVSDTGLGPPSITDMGAYELCSADFNRDSTINFYDVGDFIDAYMSSNIDADINGDGQLNTTDIFRFITQYHIGC